MTRCLDIVDAVSLIPYRGIFEHRMLKPAIILFPSFTKQILWVSCQLGSLGSTCWSGVRGITPGTNSGGWGKRRWSRSYGKPLDWDASLEPVEREGIKDDWVVQTLCSYGKKLCSFGRPGRKLWCRAELLGSLTDQGWRTCLSLRGSVLDWHCLQSGWSLLGTGADLLDSRSWKWSIACSSAQGLSGREILALYPP